MKKRLGVAFTLMLLTLVFAVPAFAADIGSRLPNIFDFSAGSSEVRAFTFTSSRGGINKEIIMPAPAVCAGGKMMIPVKALADLVGADVYTEESTWSASLFGGSFRLTGETGKPIKLYLFGRLLLPDAVSGAVTVEREGHLYVPVRILQFLGGFDFIVGEPPCLKVTALRW